MSTRLARAAALAAALLSAVAGAAEAGPPGKWTKMTALEEEARNTDEVGVARTPNGVLHVLWTRQEAGNAASLLHTALSANARTRTGPDPVAAFSGGLNNRPALVTAGGGLRAFFAGLQEGSPISDAMATATSSNGKAWVLQPTPASNGSSSGKSPVYAGLGLGAALASGNAVSTWGDSTPGGGGYHVGLDSSAPDARFGPPCCAIDPNIGVDGASGAAVLAYNLVDPPDSATVVQPLGGARARIPGSGASQTQQRVGITGRSAGKPGVYVAYTQGDNEFLGRPALFRVGDSKGRLVSSQRRARHVSVAAGPKGRLWVFWAREGRFYATRTNTAATRFGATVSVKPPKGTSSTFRLAGEGSRGPLDLLAHLDRSGDTLASWQTRILPGLTVRAKSKDGKVTASVSDAGARVKGARVKVGRKSGRTGAGGSVVFALAEGTYAVGATKKGYSEARTRVRVK